MWCQPHFHYTIKTNSIYLRFGCVGVVKTFRWATQSLEMPSPEKIVMAVAGTLLVATIALLVLSIVLASPMLRTISLYTFGGTLFVAFLPLLLLLLVMLPYEHFTKQSRNDD